MQYRAYLFNDLLDYRGMQPSPMRILEIGPKDGLDSWRLAGLQPCSLTLLDLPERWASSSGWFKALQRQYPFIDCLAADITTYDLQPTAPYRLIWCTGVLYHNAEQLRLIRKLYDALEIGGVLVLESAVIRNPVLRWFNTVQVLYPFSQRVKDWYHLSARVTHLPSKKAIKSWLEMAGFRRIQESTCHRQVSWRLALNRVAYLATK